MGRLPAAIVLLLAGIGAGCAGVHTGRVATRPPGSEHRAASADDPSLEQYIARVRVRAQQATIPPARQALPSLESTDANLRAALKQLALAPSPVAHRAVASAYFRAGVNDQAFDHFTAALRLDHTDAGAYDGLARIWRTWGFPHLGLADAHRALFYAPSSAPAHNTLGTLLQALGQPEQARRAYRAALALDPQAAYALSNLCALDLREGRLAEAQTACKQALALDPSLLAARRNLALVGAQGLPSGDGGETATGTVPPGVARPPGE